MGTTPISDSGSEHAPGARRGLISDIGDASSDDDDLVGTTLSDSYVVTRILGEGGMGRVYEARHTRIEGKRFAIKTLHPELARVPDLVARFQREAHAAAAIDSPHVVGVYDVDETEDGRPFLVSELLEGIELASYMERAGRLPAAPAVRILRQLCTALAAAHRVGAVHRDLKPENVFLTGDPSAPIVKVLDFGIAKFDDQASLTKTGMVMGTPSFMAPEQARGERVDQRADIYALGAILYAMLTGRAPYEGDDPAGIVVQVMTREPERASAIEPSIPAALELCIERAMARERDQRYADVAQLDADLAPFASAEGELPDITSLVRSGASSAASRTHEVGDAMDERARDDVLAYGALAVGALGLGLWSALSALVRLKQGGVDARVSGGVTVLLAFAVILVVGVPAFLLSRRLRPSSELADTLRVPVSAGAFAFGAGTLCLRFAELVLVRGSGAAWPGWDLILFAVGLTAAGGAAAVRWDEMRSGPRSPLSALSDRRVPVLAAAALALVLLFLVLPLLRG